MLFGILARGRRVVNSRSRHGLGRPIPAGGCRPPLRVAFPRRRPKLALTQVVRSRRTAGRRKLALARVLCRCGPLIPALPSRAAPCRRPAPPSRAAVGNSLTRVLCRCGPLSPALPPRAAPRRRPAPPSETRADASCALPSHARPSETRAGASSVTLRPAQPRRGGPLSPALPPRAAFPRRRPAPSRAAVPRRPVPPSRAAPCRLPAPPSRAAFPRRRPWPLRSPAARCRWGRRASRC